MYISSKPQIWGLYLKKIEIKIKNSDHIDKNLLRAKTVVNSKLALL